MNELQQLYNTLVREGKYTRSFDEFQQRFNQDEAYRNKVYGVVYRDGIYTKDKESFLKEYSAPVATTQTPAAQAPAAQTPTLQDVKKKEDTTALPSGLGSSVSSASADNLGALGVKVQDESILTKQPREPKIDESRMLAASESTRVPNLRIPQKEQQPDEIDKKLQQIEKQKLEQIEQERLAFLNNPTPTTEEDYFQGTFGSVLRTFDNYSPIGLGDVADDIARAIASGYRSGDLAQAANKIIRSGNEFTDEDVQKLIDKQAEFEALGPSKEYQDYYKTYVLEGKTVWGAVKGLMENPTVFPEVFVSSLVSMATNREAALAAAGTLAAAYGVGATTGGTAGTFVIPGVGTVGGAAAAGLSATVSAVPYAFGAASTIIETGSVFAQGLQEQLGTDENGNPVKPTKENVRAILEDPEKYNKIKNDAIVRGFTVGIIDAVGGKLATGVGAKILKKSAAATGNITKKGLVKSIAAGGVIEGGAGATGEVLGQVFIDKPIDKGNAVLEFMAEMPGAVRTTLMASLKTPTYKINGGKVSAEEIDTTIATMTPEQLAASDIEIYNDFDGRKEKLQDKIVTGAIAKEIREAQPDLNEPTVNAIVALQKELNKLEGNKTQVAKDRAAVLRARIKELQENPLPETPSTEQAAPTVETPTSLTEELAQSIAAQATIFTEADRARKKELEDGIADARARGITIGENLINELNELKKKEQDAIQKQAAGQVPVQPTTTVGQEVEGGTPQAEPQVVAEEGQVQEEINEEDIALSGLSDGFRAVTRNSFDVRSDSDVMQKIGNNESFATSVTKNGKKYVVVGLRLKEDVGATTSGRDGYSFATIEDNGNLPANTVDVLTKKAVSNISSIYRNINNPTIDLFKPIESQEVTPAVSPTQQEVAGPLKDVQSTALALNEDLISRISEEANMFFPSTEDSNIRIAESYHKAKADGSNPDLVRAVEKVLGETVQEQVVSSETQPAVSPTISPAVSPTISPAVSPTVSPAVSPEPVVVAPAPTPTAQPIVITDILKDIKVSFAPENAIEVQKGTREDVSGRKFTYDAAVTAQATDRNGTPIGLITKRSNEDGILSFTLKNTSGQNINKGKAYPTERDARMALAEQVNRVRAKAAAQPTAAPAPTPTAPVVEVVATEPVVAPTPEPVVAPTPEPVVEEEEGPELVTVKEMKSNTPTFTKDNASYYDESSKEDSMGREVTYISSITVDALDANGDSIGTITKLIDEEKNVSYTAEDEYGYQIKRGEEFYTLNDVMSALADNVNKRRQKEFQKEKAKQAKAKEKAAAKARLAEEKKAAKKAAKEMAVEAERIINSEEATPEFLERAYNVFDELEKKVGNTAKRNLNDALLGIPLTTLQAALKAVKVLIKGGIAVRDAIRRVAAENKINENKLREAFVALTRPVVSDLATEGVGVKLTGEEDIITGENNPTVKTKKGYKEDYSAEEIFRNNHAPNSRVITTASNIALGKISYTKDGEKITFQLPYLNINLYKKIQALRNEYKSIKGTSKQAKAEKAKLKKEINKVAKKVLSDFTDIMSQNLLALYDTLAPDFVKNSKEWYVGANRMANAIADKYNMTVEQVGGIIAALSPQNDWFNNVSVAERTIEIMTKYADTKLTKDIVDKAVSYNSKKGKDPSSYALDLLDLFNQYGEVSINELQKSGISTATQAAILRAFDQAINSPKVAVTDPTGAFVGFDSTPVRWNSEAEISKAINIFRNGSVENVNENLGNGNKVRNFYNNIVDPNSSTPYVTADTHALSAVLNSPISANDAGGFGLFNGSLEPSYALVKEAYIRASQVAGILPREMQSITWEAQRIGINDKNRTEAKKQELFDYISESRKNNETAYERATELIARNRSADPTWGKGDGITTQIPSDQIRQGAKLRAEQRISALSDLRGGTEGRVGAADTAVGERATGRKGFDEIVDLDVKSKDNLAIVSDFLESIDRSISKRLRTNANDALLAIPLTVVQGMVRGINVLVKGGMTVRDAIKKIAADNNISQEKFKDLISLISIADEFNTLMANADALIARQRSKGIDEKKIVSNLDTMVRKFYQDLDVTDNQRKIMEREARARMGVEPRKAASIGRILGVLKDITNVSREDKLKIISRIRELGRDVGKDLANEIREMADSGKITLNQAASIIARTLNLNPLNEASVSNFVDYIAKVFSKADYVGKMTTALNQIKQAKKNIKTKIGVAQDLFEPLNQLLSINPTLIPLNQLEKYLKILEDFSARKTVLSVPDRVKVLKQVNEILDEIKNERSSVDALADRFNNYDGKVLDEDGNLSYSETINNMIDKGLITVSESELMKKYKSEILPQVEKVELTDEQIETDKKKQIEILKKLEVDNKEFPLPSRDEKEVAMSLAKLIKQLSVEDLMNLSLADLKNIIKVIDNINNGYLPHYAKISVEKLNSIKSGKVLSNAIERANPLSFSKLYSRLKNKFTNKGAIDELIRANPEYYMDNVFGDFKTRDIFNSLFEKSAQALATFNSELRKVDQKIEAAQNKVLASFTQNPDKYLMSKFRMTAYMLQREYESNIGKKGVKPVTEYLKETIKHIRRGKSIYKEDDAKKLEQILEQVESYTVDGKVDLDKFYNTFNNAEKNAIEVMTEINNSLGEMAAHTAAVIRGDKVELIDNYVHHNVLHEQNPMDATAAPEFSDSYSNSIRPTTKAKSLIERTGDVTPLNFDLFTATHKGAKFVLLDYNLTSPIRTARRTLIQAGKNLEEKGLMNKEKAEIFNAINNAYEESLQNILTNSIAQDPLGSEVVDFIQKQGYRTALAGTVRFKAELLSNIINALIINPKGFATGLKNAKLIASANGYEFMKNAKSKQTSRLYASDALSGKMVDPQILKQTSGVKGSVSRGALMNRTLQVYNLTLKKLIKNPVEYIADTMLTTPDKVVSMPLWFGSFMNEFKKITGEEVNQEMMINNDLDYMQKYEDAIEQATRKADQESVYSGATNNEFMGILKGRIKPNQNLREKVWNNFNSYMTNFMNFDYAAARSAVYNLFNEGYMTKRKAAAVLAGITTRSVIYQVMVANMGAGIIGVALGLAFDWEDEEEVDEKTFYQKFGRSLANVLVGYTVGRNFGNVVRGMVNVGVEKINEEYLDFLRNGEYDFYKDNIAYTYLPVSEQGNIDIPKTAVAMAGSYTPALSTAVLIGKNFDAISSKVMGEGPTKKEPEAIRREQMTVDYRIPLEVAGNLGLVPFYKDVKKAVNDEIYKDLRKAASTPDSSLPSADEYEKLKDLRELRNKTSNKDELKEIDREILKIVGSEESKESIEKIQEIKSEKKKRLLYDASKSIRYDNESDMKRLNPALWRKRFGPNSEWAKSNKAENAVENKLGKIANKREDREYRKNR